MYSYCICKVEQVFGLMPRITILFNIDNDCFHLIVLFIFFVEEAFEEIIRFFMYFTCFRLLSFSWICDQLTSMYLLFAVVINSNQDHIHISKRLKMKNVTIEVENYAQFAFDLAHFNSHSLSGSKRIKEKQNSKP